METWTSSRLPSGSGPALGSEPVETADLLALLLDGPRAATRRTACKVLLARDLGELASAPPGELVREFGLAGRDAERLSAALQLGRRLEPTRRLARPPLRSAQKVYALLSAQLFGLEQEVFCLLLLDGKHRLRRQQLITVGTLTSSIVHPREVFRPAVREAAAAVIVAHNHPSGDPEPSREDLEVTRRLCAAGELLGIPLLDHVVLGDGSFVSLRDRMPFPSGAGSARSTPRGSVRGSVRGASEDGGGDRHGGQGGGFDP